MNKRATKRKRGYSMKEYKEILREGINQERMIDNKGNEIIINPLKHILLNEKYKDDEKNKYLKDVLKTYRSFLNQAKEDMKKAEEPTVEIVSEEVDNSK